MLELSDQQKHFVALRTQLRESCASARRDAALFAVLTVFLTPVAVAIFLLILLFALALVDFPVVDHLGYRVSFITGANLCLAFMAASYFLRPKERYRQREGDTTWLSVAAGLFCTLLALCYFTSLANFHPVGFWLIYLLVALGMLGCIGHAYEPHDDYYLGWTYGPILIDDPFTIQDDIDRAHIGLGFAVSMAHLILDSYGAIFGSRWLWRGLEEIEISTAATLLQGIAARETASLSTHMKSIRPEIAAEALRALVKLDLVAMDRGRPRLSMKGQEFMAQIPRVDNKPVFIAGGYPAYANILERGERP